MSQVIVFSFLKAFRMFKLRILCLMFQLDIHVKKKQKQSREVISKPRNTFRLNTANFVHKETRQQECC